MESNWLVISYYLGLLVFVGNFLVLRKAIRSYDEIKIVEKRIVNIVRALRRKR